MTESTMNPLSELTDAELSEAVAVEVMGWSRCPPEVTTNWLRPVGDGVCEGRGYVPAYATDIAAAMAVFTYIHDEDETEFMSISVDDYGRSCTESAWDCKIEPIGGGAYEAMASTIPRVICEAALLWARARNMSDTDGR